MEVGDSLVYTITIRQTAGASMGTVNVIDRLPHGFTYIDGTARVDNAGIAKPLGKPGPTLVFDVGALAVGQQKVLTLSLIHISSAAPCTWTATTMATATRANRVSPASPW